MGARALPAWIATALVGAGCGGPTGPPPAESAWLGAAACAECHPEETAAWTGSDHDLAMQPATPATVLGDFADATAEHAGVTTRFHRDGDRFLVTTDGPDGAPADFEVAYTFGVRPLQQYLVPFPDGRLQVLPWCWDARPAEEGGQRWFHLYPDETLPAGDVLHWTGPNQNWNHVCAECHSTRLRKGYDLAADRFETTWSEIDVACEACHGPGGAHVAWARARRGRDPRLAVRLGDHDGGWWAFPEGKATAARRPPRTERPELEVCARCHSRRSQIAVTDPGAPFLDGYRPALLEEGLYHPDGQIQDEVYVWGSFLQSRMYAAGVTCSDCHDPHSLRLRSPGDSVCNTCHSPAPYRTRAHHHHDPAREGADCTGCHMPQTAYMRIDLRADHSLRVPRPDLSRTTGAPNACNRCHDDRDPAWAAARMDEWYGKDWRKPTPAPALAAARRGDPAAAADLRAAAADPELPAIVRATALAALRGFPAPEQVEALRAGLADPEPLVRLGALQGLGEAGLQIAATLAFPLLEDPVRAVRIEAARLTAALPAVQLPEHWRGVWQRALDEYEASLRIDDDRASAHLNRALLQLARKREDLAEREYRMGLRLDPANVLCAVNLADLLRGQKRDAEGEEVLRRLLARVPDAAAAEHALGLLLVRRGEQDEALSFLRRAVDHAPRVPRYRYVLAVALRDLGRPEEALAEVRAALAERPEDPAFRELLRGLASAEPDPKPGD
ncbi:MAG: hypothetical protein D6702_11105 [Planctomycetota bacterium]|nr:MAG: hypothetical protein D6702_11105 [Planctomycetota bacterium]